MGVVQFAVIEAGVAVVKSVVSVVKLCVVLAAAWPTFLVNLHMSVFQSLPQLSQGKLRVNEAKK